MLNYNLNINSPLQQEKKNEDVRPPIYWDFHSFASASDASDLSERTFATMSINTPNTNCIQVSVDSGNSFVSDAQSEVTASVTGSNWPITGSTTMSLFTAGITFDPLAVDQFYFSSVSASGTQIIANPSISGSIITNKFLAAEFYRWYVSGSVVHIKGNVFNPLVNWKAQNQSPVTTTGNVNGYTASFNIVKDVNVALVNINEVTASISSSFNYAYNFGVTASLTASINNVTGSTTMSIEIPQTGVSASQQWFNPSTTEAKLTGSFVATNNNPYNITASVIFNKGNINNPLVKVLATGSNSIYSNSQGTNTILNIVKNVNEPISMSIGNITGSQTTQFQYEYAFNITSSLTGSANWPRSASHLYPTMSLSIPEAGINVISYQTASIITASFAANTNTTYTITASITPRYIPAFSASFYLFAGGGGGASTTIVSTQPGGGGGAGAMFTGSFNISPNRTYTVVVGAGGAADTSGNTTQFNGFDMGTIEIPITMSLQGGRNGSGMNGGNSGTGSYTIGTTTTQLPAFTGGSGDADSGGGTIRYAAGGGAGSSQNGVSGIAFPNRISGAGGNGFVGLAGGGGGGGADKRNFAGATAGAGGDFGGGIGGGATDTNQNGFPATAFGAGGGGATSTSVGNSGGTGYQGVLLLSYPGTGSRFTATGNYSLSYLNGITTYTFNPGSSSFSYVYEPELNPAPLT